MLKLAVRQEANAAPTHVTTERVMAHVANIYKVIGVEDKTAALDARAVATARSKP